MAARLVNLLVLALECAAMMVNPSGPRLKALIYYTRLSNLMTAIASLLLVIFGDLAWVRALRYLSACMMVMTFFVTTCVLIPLGGDPKRLLWSGKGLFHHVLCPALTVLSYILLEGHAGSGLLPLPVLVTLAYGLVLLLLNARRRVDGPYPFFQVYRRSAAATALWMVALTLAVTAISALVWLAGR